MYVDVRSLMLAPRFASREEAETPGARLAPRAVKALSYVAEAGHDLVLLGEGPELRLVGESLGPLVHASRPTLPDDALGWLVTSDPALCAGSALRVGLRTVLVGVATGDVGLARRTWDTEARDLLAAALVILGEDAMPNTKEGR